MAKPFPPISYGDYLRTQDLLRLQNKRSEQFGIDAHDELLFITVHQTYELWFKQILAEIDSVLKVFSQPRVDEGSLGLVVARLQRVIEIQKVLIDQVRILETMTPLDFLEFRDCLYPASGFQSVQFRLIENKLGLKRDQRLPFNAMPYTAYVSDEERAVLEASEKQASLFESLEKWLERTPFLETQDFAFWKAYREAVQTHFAADLDMVMRNTLLSENQKQASVTEIKSNEAGFEALFDDARYHELQAQGAWRLSHRALHAALLIHLYRDKPVFQLPFRVLVALQDIDELFTTWRYRHALMAQRMLGSKIGTGGSSGHRYLKAATDQHRIFNDLFNLATFLIPRSSLPKLPMELEERLGFFFERRF